MRDHDRGAGEGLCQALLKPRASWPHFESRALVNENPHGSPWCRAMVASAFGLLRRLLNCSIPALLPMQRLRHRGLVVVGLAETQCRRPGRAL